MTDYSLLLSDTIINVVKVEAIIKNIHIDPFRAIKMAELEDRGNENQMKLSLALRCSLTSTCNKTLSLLDFSHACLFGLFCKRNIKRVRLLCCVIEALQVQVQGICKLYSRNVEKHSALLANYRVLSITQHCARTRFVFL